MNSQTEKTTTQSLSEIGASHQPSVYPRVRQIVAANGELIGLMDCFEANAFVARAHSAA